MPRYWRRPYYQRRYRYRGFWRPRKTFRRRRYRTRRVRTFKLFKQPKLNLKQWNPPTMRKCKIKGQTIALLFNQSRLPFNSVMYENSYVPEGQPGGGGFSVMQFTLSNLYSMFQKCTNWWTTSNEDLPLCRYRGCKLKLYQSEILDYTVKYTNTLPGNSNKLTYPSTQPSIINMANTKIIMPSRKTNNKRKPYTTVRIKPPSPLETRWYFQKDIQTKPLVILHTSGISLQNYYISPEWESNNITITHLNTDLINYRNFLKQFWPYWRQGTVSKYFYKLTNPNIQDINQAQIQYIVPLTNMQHWTSGDSFHDAHLKYPSLQWATYKNQDLFKYSGNPFLYQNLNNEFEHYYTSTVSPVDLFTAASKETDTLATITVHAEKPYMQKVIEPLILKSRYNPFKDTGTSTKMYLLPVHTDGDFSAPTDLDQQLDGFPLWINIWGFTDFQKQLKNLQQIDTKYILVFENHTTNPIRNKPIVVIDNDYLNGKSPYSNNVHPDDAKKWYPQLQYQTQSMNSIAMCGLGTPKHPNLTSDQVKIGYTFYFTWGGSPAKMVTVENPDQQIVYPMPRTEHETPSLQSPAQAFESVLYTFDERSHQLTQKAFDRIKKDWGLTEPLSSITETTREVPVQQTFQTQGQETQTTKESEKELLQQLNLHKQQQLELRYRILQLMQTMHM
nr:MAG: ORF1 [TTV-like mini virus]UGV37380.1 MAG: ORF1 [TTV-like mini virus]UGV38218.1 MAG: ORF1 [TTV-like mini virus]